MRLSRRLFILPRPPNLPAVPSYSRPNSRCLAGVCLTTFTLGPSLFCNDYLAVSGTCVCLLRSHGQTRRFQKIETATCP